MTTRGSLFHSAFTVSLVAAAAVGLLAACGADPGASMMPGGDAGPMAPGNDAGTGTGGECACTITFNGAPVAIACGTDACLGSTRFACSATRSLAPQGACMPPASQPDAGRADTGDGPLCTNTCRTANDGECDDGGPGSLYNVCALGTDCADCGPRVPGAVSDGGRVDSGGTCTPACSGRTCGSDGCGGQCGPGCASGQTCEAGSCVGPRYGAPCSVCDELWATTRNCAVSGTAEVTRQCGMGGWCRRGPLDSAGYCTAPCRSGSPCPSGYACRDVMVGQNFCVRP